MLNGDPMVPDNDIRLVGWSLSLDAVGSGDHMSSSNDCSSTLVHFSVGDFNNKEGLIGVLIPQVHLLPIDNFKRFIFRHIVGTCTDCQYLKHQDGEQINLHVEMWNQLSAKK